MQALHHMSKIILHITLLATAFWLTACSGPKKESAGQHDEEGHHDEHENTNTASLTLEQIKSIGIQMGVVEKKQLTASLKAAGVLRVPNQNKASVNSVYSGVVRSLRVQPGNSVRKGQVLATIGNPSFVQPQSDYLAVMSKIRLAEQEVARQRELNAGNAGALKNLQAAEAELRTLQTSRATLEQQIRLMGITPAQLSNGKLVSELAVRSPINGVVSSVPVEMGSYVDVTTPIAGIVDNSQLHVDLFVYEKDLSKLKNGQTIHFTLTNNPGKEYDADIFSLGSTFEGESKAVSVHARVKGDKNGLIDGMGITAIISLESASVPAVPVDAIVSHQGQDYIFLVKDGDAEDEHHSHDHEESNSVTFEKIPVVKGTTDIGYTEITLLKEIPADAKIVVKGAFFVLAKMTNAGEAHEH